jgi:hypothetical protein
LREEKKKRGGASGQGVTLKSGLPNPRCSQNMANSWGGSGRRHGRMGHGILSESHVSISVPSQVVPSRDVCTSSCLKATTTMSQAERQVQGTVAGRHPSNAPKPATAAVDRSPTGTQCLIEAARMSTCDFEPGRASAGSRYPPSRQTQPQIPYLNIQPVERPC